MGADQYHEPPEELSHETRTFVRLCTSLIEEADAINWYEQRLGIERNPVARAIMTNAVGEEYKHFAMDLEFLLRQKPEWREIAQGVLFTEGDIVDAGEESEESAREDDPTVEVKPSGSDPPLAAPPPPAAGSSSLGIGSLKGQA